MQDPKMKGRSILSETGCRGGAHSFVWTGVLPPQGLRCNCGAYAHEETLDMLAAEQQPGGTP